MGRRPLEPVKNYKSQSFFGWVLVIQTSGILLNMVNPTLITWGADMPPPWSLDTLEQAGANSVER